MQYFVIFAIVIAMVIGGPIASIEALNVLFNLSIPITIQTWLASFWLTSILGSSFVKARTK